MKTQTVNNERLANIRTYGTMHGTRFYHSKRHPEAHLAMMEGRLKADAMEAYMAGFLEGMEGLHRYRWPLAREERKQLS